MIRPPLRKTKLSDDLIEFSEGDIQIAKAVRRGSTWHVEPNGILSDQSAVRCSNPADAIRVVNDFATRRAMRQLRLNIEAQLERAGLTHQEVYGLLRMHKTQYFLLFDERVARGPTVKTLRNLASVIGCTVADLVAGI